MANEKQLAILRQGPKAWNSWRKENPDTVIDLSKAGLSADEMRDVDLSGANLQHSTMEGHPPGMFHLNNANFKQSLLAYSDFGYPWQATNTTSPSACFNCFQNANLSGSILDCTSLQNADLRGANLSNTLLYRTNFHGADLSNVDFTGAQFNDVILTRANLTGAIGLESCSHTGPSSLDMQTLMMSGNLPKGFLRGCGLPKSFIEVLPTILEMANQYHSCFISHSTRDSSFVDKLYSYLQDQGLLCWYSPEDMKTGDKILNSIDKNIVTYDKLLLVLSDAAIASNWVEDEVTKAFAEERRRGKNVLFPIRIDDAVLTTDEPWAVKIRDSRHIADFTAWQDSSEFERVALRLIGDLSVEANNSKQP